MALVKLPNGNYVDAKAIKSIVVRAACGDFMDRCVVGVTDDLPISINADSLDEAREMREMIYMAINEAAD